MQENSCPLHTLYTFLSMQLNQFWVLTGLKISNRKRFLNMSAWITRESISTSSKENGKKKIENRITSYFQESEKLKPNVFTYFFIKTVIHDRFTKHCNQRRTLCRQKATICTPLK